jgi:hypothetical protein
MTNTVVLFAISVPVFIIGSALTSSGTKTLRGISDHSPNQPDLRMARAEKMRARWGMQWALPAPR